MICAVESLIPIAIVTVIAMSISVLCEIPYRRTVPFTVFLLISIMYLFYITGINISFLLPSFGALAILLAVAVAIIYIYI